MLRVCWIGQIVSMMIRFSRNVMFFANYDSWKTAHKSLKHEEREGRENEILLMFGSNFNSFLYCRIK